MNGQRTMTRLAGRFTPADKVEVAMSTRKLPCLKEPSMISLSSYVSPKFYIIFNQMEGVNNRY